MLAHVAMHEAICCVSNIFGKTEKMDYTNVPSVVYTNPEIGCVGLTEEMAKQRKIDFDVAQVMFRAIGRSHTSGEISGDAKILFDKKSKKILEIHVIGPHASENPFQCQFMARWTKKGKAWVLTKKRQGIFLGHKME